MNEPPNPPNDPKHPHDEEYTRSIPPISDDATQTTPSSPKKIAHRHRKTQHPTRVGHYKILEPIGEGGMGTVYLAEQTEPVQRKVALKLIKLGMDTKQVIARFDSERQALAMMDHPNVAKMFDAGASEQGRPYFVMEYVRGIPITDYCDKHRLTTKERLTLFMQVCQAIQHAHQKGIIHRDIKPSNVLVSVKDGEAVPKVIDFGVAKATQQKLTEKTLFTEMGQLVGTPAYMSPEQADLTALDIDTRSDLYSLGVVLYELLAGALPFEPSSLRQAAFGEIQRIIREEEPPKPSTRLSSLGHESGTVAQKRQTNRAGLEKLLRGDLDWITMKALEKDRTRRYQTSNGLAMDIERYLADEPVLAGPPSAAYRMRKFVRRNRGGVIAGAAIAVALVLGVVGTSWGLVWALREKDRADAAAKAETDARAEAQQQAKRAQAVNKFLTDDLLAGVDPTRTQDRDITMREVLDEASLRIAARFKNQPLVRAYVERTLGEVYTRLGVYSPAEKHYRHAYELLSAAQGERDRDTLSTRGELNNLLFYTGKYEQGILDMEATLAVMRDALGQDNLVTLRAMGDLALLYAEQNQPDKAEPMYLRAIAGLDKAVGPRHRDAMSARNSLALLYMDRRQYDKAQTLLKTVCENMRDEYGEADPDTLQALANLAHLYNEMGRSDESERIGVTLLETARRVLGNEHWTTHIVLNNLAVAYVRTDRLDLAEPLYRENFETSLRIFGAEHPGTLTSMTNLGRLYMRMGRFEDAVGVLTESVVLTKKVKPPGHIGIGITLHSLGEALLRLDRFEEAIPPLLEAYDVLLPTLGHEHRGIKKLIRQLTTAYEKMGNTEAAAEWRSRMKQTQTDESPESAPNP